MAWMLTWKPAAAQDLAREVSVDALTRREPDVSGRSRHDQMALFREIGVEAVLPFLDGASHELVQLRRSEAGGGGQIGGQLGAGVGAAIMCRRKLALIILNVELGGHAPLPEIAEAFRGPGAFADLAGHREENRGEYSHDEYDR